VPETTTKAKASKARGIEEAVSYAIGHRIRVEMLCLLNEGTRSADELARVIRQPLSKATHHIRELLDSGSIEIARVEKVRNVSQNYYRAVEIPFFSDEEMAAKTTEERQAIYGLILQASTAEALASLWSGKIKDDPRVWLSWCWFNVDDEGRGEIADELAASWERLREIEVRATSRRIESGKEAVSMIVTSMGFERSRGGAASTFARGKA
jgi:DNA-binding transcriptional ArsR family regulator